MTNLAVAAMLFLLVACTGSARNTSTTQQGSARSLVTSEEIARSGVTDGFSAVQVLRPNWLLTRGTDSLSGGDVIRVYVDGQLLGGPDYLRQITAESIARIQRLDAMEATQRYGLGHGLGAILVFTIRK